MSTMTGLEATRDRDAARVPVLGLTVLYDASCSLCTFLRDWLGKQPQLVPLRLVPAGSELARALFPALDHRATLDEITVVGDGGQVYRGAAAWVVCLWALCASTGRSPTGDTRQGPGSPRARCSPPRSGAPRTPSRDGRGRVPAGDGVGVRTGWRMDVPASRL